MSARFAKRMKEQSRKFFPNIKTSHHRSLSIRLQAVGNPVCVGLVRPQVCKIVPPDSGDRQLTYAFGLKKLWRPHFGPVEWHYLDQFEKTGHVVLILQSKGNKIEQQTAQTEVLLDEAFRDTVERVIAPRKSTIKINEPCFCRTVDAPSRLLSISGMQTSPSAKAKGHRENAIFASSHRCGQHSGSASQ